VERPDRDRDPPSPLVIFIGTQNLCHLAVAVLCPFQMSVWLFFGNRNRNRPSSVVPGSSIRMRS